MLDSVPDTPNRDKNVAPGSADEDGDYETIATVPIGNHSLTPTQRFTQPTQLVDMPYSRPDSQPVLQVAASSPPGPAHSPPRRAGILASLMAPSGTHFRPPPTSLGPSKRSSVIDLDDGPTYLGGSSDDEEHYTVRSTDIKPAMFEKASRSPEKEKVAESPVRNETGAMDRFKKITASAVYDPTSNGVKRAADQMSSAHAPGLATKKPRQDAPARAQPVLPQFLELQDITDHRVRVKVERIQKVMPSKTVQECADALYHTKGNFDAAMNYLANIDLGNEVELDNVVEIESSEDELNTTPARKGAAPIAKQQVKARGTIQDKWAAMNLPAGSTHKDAGVDDVKPRGRLIRGSKNRQSPSRTASPSAAISIPSDDTPPKRKTGRLQKGRRRLPSDSPEPEMTDSDDSDVQDEAPTAGGLVTKVLKFFNTCDARNLVDTASTSQENADAIIAHRPFASLDDVRSVNAPVNGEVPTKGKGRGRKPPKPIGEKIVEKCLEMFTGYQAIDALVAECEALGKPLANEMKKWGVDIFGKRDGEFELTSIGPIAKGHDSGIATPSSNQQSPSADDDEDEDDLPVVSSRKHQTKSRFISQPSIMAEGLEMKDYQIVGINWLSLLFEKNLSCILADDMGLGKTCQVIAFLAHLFEKNIKGPHLIVVPASTIENWLREFSKFCPKLVVTPYYAGQNERALIREQIEENRDEINVVVTTYTVARAKVDSKFLRDMDFCACVYDEGHMLKNHQSQLYEKLIRIPARFRLLLTGTPLQNNLQELASLLGFILPNVFLEHKEDLHAVFSNKAKTTDESHETLLSAQRIERAKSMLKPFVLRRKKHQVIDLPAKHARVQRCEMKPSQRDIYDNEREQVRQLLEDRAAGKKTGSRSANIMMKLRQAAIHPLLARRHYTDAILRKMAKACLKEPKWAASDPAVIFEELLAYNDFECHRMCVENPSSLGKYKLKNEEWMDSGKVDQLRVLLERFIQNGDRTLIFSQFTMVMDILENVLETLKIEFVRLDGRTSVEDRQSILDHFHEHTEIPVFLLSTKAGGAGINLACANKVIIHDSSFNPQEDVQAENRAHRVGQTRDVEVIRFVSAGTIEEQIYALGQTKLALDQAVTGEDDGSKRSEEAGMKAVEAMVLADLEKEKGGAGDGGSPGKE